MQSFVSRLFDKLDFFAVKQDRRVSFLQEKEPGELDQAVCDGGGVEDPAPRGIFSNLLTVRNFKFPVKCDLQSLLQWVRRLVLGQARGHRC